MQEDGREGDTLSGNLTAVATPAARAVAPSPAVAMRAARSAPSPPATPSRRFTGIGMTLLALAFALGIAIGWKQPTPLVWPWLWAALACAVAALLLRLVRRHAASIVALLAGMTFLGAGWITLKHERVATNDLAALIGDESVLVHLDGLATRGPELRSRTAGSMARFDYRAPATYFPMTVEHLLPRDGPPVSVTGAVLVRVDQTLAPFRAGDRVIVTGFLLRPAMPRNPGEFDFRDYAKSLGQAGILTVSGRDLVQVRPAERSSLATWLLNWRDELRRRAGAWLLADLPDNNRTTRDALLISLLLGERDAEIDRVYASFQRVGLAHILAISGFHLAVLAGFVMLIARLFGGARAWHGWLVIAAVLLYLMLVEPGMPVLRAGVMTVAGCLAATFGRRLRVAGLVSLSAIVLLLWRPDQLFNSGFQLTYSVVLGLIHLSPQVRRRWFGPHNPEAATSGEMLGQWLRAALTVSVVAWLIATPLAAFHFGSVALVGIPMSIIAVPLSAVILALGYVKIVLSALLPSAALLLGVPLTISANVLLAIVGAVDEFPLSNVHVPPPTTLWTLVALAWVCWWSLGRRHESRAVVRLKYACIFAVALWLAWPILSLPRIPLLRSPQPQLRIDMLAVGDGSCYVLRSGGQTMVFDAGSSTDLDAGRRSIIPAMRRLGVRRVDCICVTHPDMDHYSAVVEIADEFNVGEIRLTPQFLASAAEPLSPMAYMLSRLTERRVHISETSAGARWTLGACAIECLHPPANARYERTNDSSMVLRISAGDRRVLLCGDIQQEAMLTVMRSGADLQSDVMELAHHGSFHDVAAGFIDRVKPEVVMQSTGWTRWQRDHWAGTLANAQRLVTVRDGACSVSIERDGAIHVERFVPQGMEAGGAEIE